MVAICVESNPSIKHMHITRLDLRMDSHNMYRMNWTEVSSIQPRTGLYCLPALPRMWLIARIWTFSFPHSAHYSILQGVLKDGKMGGRPSKLLLLTLQSTAGEVQNINILCTVHTYELYTGQDIVWTNCKENNFHKKRHPLTTACHAAI